MDAFVGEIRMFGGNFAPIGWALCDGQEIPCGSAYKLYTVIKNAYGGVPDKTFKLPLLCDVIPPGAANADFKGGSYVIGKNGGNNGTYTVTTVPAHTHTFNGTTFNPLDKQTAPTNAFNATFPNERTATRNRYKQKLGDTVIAGQLDSSTVSLAGTDTPKAISNMQATLVHNFIICYDGIMPF